MERGGYTVATTYASSYNINFRGCSKFVSGPVFLSSFFQESVKILAIEETFHCCNFFFGTAQCQFAHIAVLKCGPAPGHMFEPAWPRKKLRKTFRGPESFPTTLPPGHMSHKRLENFQGPGKFFHRPTPGHMFEPAWSHKNPENSESWWNEAR